MTTLEIVRAAWDRPATPAERQRGRAVSVIARRLFQGAWPQDGEAVRHQTASRLLEARIRLNRAGLLRWRNTRVING